jgi:hypothetical protein
VFSVGPVSVVVVDVDGRTCSSCLRLVIRSQSRQSRRTVPTQRSANAFAFGARNGVRMLGTSRSCRPVPNRAVGPSVLFGPGSHAGYADAGLAHSAGPFWREWAVAGRNPSPLGWSSPVAFCGEGDRPGWCVRVFG